MTLTCCQVCEGSDLHLLYEMQSGLALTSLGETYPASTRVWACRDCSHLQTDEMAQVEQYYAEQYNILSDSEDEDQVYEVQDGKPLYRTEHQLHVLLNTLVLPQAARVLDYGCAKSSTMQALLKARGDLQIHLFDVSDNYRRFWARFLPESRCATFEPNAQWLDSFDLVTSFFALEHIVRPLEALQAIYRLVRPGGHFYCIVPNVETNIADFIVVDHVNHFTELSLTHVLQRAGFEVDAIDSSSHRGAFVVLARRPLTDVPERRPDAQRVTQHVQALQRIGHRAALAAIGHHAAVQGVVVGVRAWTIQLIDQPAQGRNVEALLAVQHRGAGRDLILGKVFYGFADHVRGFTEIEVQRGICVRNHGTSLARAPLPVTVSVLTGHRPVEIIAGDQEQETAAEGEYGAGKGVTLAQHRAGRVRQETLDTSNEADEA